MKINVNQIPSEGSSLVEEIPAQQLDLETDLIKFRSNLKLKGQLYRITNVLTADLNIKVLLYADCARCLDEFEWEFNKDVQLNYPIDSSANFIDMDPQIREEVILDYPIKFLCDPNCKGLCAKCGKNKNQGGCNCGST